MAAALLMCAFGATAAVGLGAAYGYALRHNPLPFANALLYIAFVVAIGFCAFMAVRVSAVRTPWLAATIAITAACVALYAAWVVWLYQFGYRTAGGHAIVWPGDLWRSVLSAAAAGPWRVFGSVPPAPLLIMLWTAEAVIVAFVAAYLAYRRAQQPFCEACRSWTAPVYEDVNLARPFDLEAFRQALESGSVHMLTALPPPEGSVFITVDLRQCKACRKIGFLTIDSIRVTSDVNGRTSLSSIPVVKNLWLNGTSLETVRELEGGQSLGGTAAGGYTGVSRW